MSVTDLTTYNNRLVVLAELCTLVNEAAFRRFRDRSSCVASSAALFHLLQGLGYEAAPIRVSAYVRSGIRGQGCGGILGWDGDGSRMKAAEPGMWHGHLAVQAEGRYLLDPTLDQVRVERWAKFGPFTADLGSAFFEERQMIWMPHGNVTVRYESFPGRGGFKSAPDWRNKSVWRPVVVDALTRCRPHHHKDFVR